MVQKEQGKNIINAVILRINTCKTPIHKIIICK